MARYKMLVRTTFRTDEVLERINQEIEKHEMIGPDAYLKWHWRELKSSHMQRRQHEFGSRIIIHQTFRFEGVFDIINDRTCTHLVTALVRYSGYEYPSLSPERDLREGLAPVGQFLIKKAWSTVSRLSKVSRVRTNF